MKSISHGEREKEVNHGDTGNTFKSFMNKNKLASLLDNYKS